MPRSTSGSTWSATRNGHSVVMARSSGVSMAGCRASSVSPLGRPATRSTNDLPGSRRRQRGEPVGEEDAGLLGQPPDGKSHIGLGFGAEQAEGKDEVHGQLEVDVEELRPHEQGVEMASRWLMSNPQRTARSSWARHSRRTSSMSA